MKKQKRGEKSIRAEIMAGTLAAVLLLGGGTAWAKKGEKIQFKKDASAQTAAQSQAAQCQVDPFRDMLQMQREMERMFSSTLSPYSAFPEFGAAMDQTFEQPMDLRETPDAYVVQMDLPGLEKSDISIELKDRVLSVSGEQKKSKEQKTDEKILLQERSVSSFAREVVLPASVDVDAVSAEYKAGVLTITLPKTEKGKDACKIKIK